MGTTALSPLRSKAWCLYLSLLKIYRPPPGFDDTNCYTVEKYTWATDSVKLQLYYKYFFSVPVCVITESGVSGGTLVSMNRFSTLCWSLVQRQGWRVKGRIWSSEQARSAKANSWLDYQRPLGEGEMGEILSVHPCGNSGVLLHAVKSYNMGPSRFTSHPRGRCATDFYRP
jgi:hypothetical protein